MSRQLALDFTPREPTPPRGGRRPGAGRPRRKDRRPLGLPHRSRAAHSRQVPLLITVRVARGVPYLRNGRHYRAISSAVLETRRDDFRLVHFTIQRDHLHFIVEAEDAAALGRGMRAAGIRIARRLNRAAGRRGRVVADRYHIRRLTCPTAVRRGLHYVLGNARHHDPVETERFGPRWVDPFSSAPHFDGWYTFERPATHLALGPPVTVAPTVWLLTTGWRERGLLLPWAVPGRA